MRSFFLLAVFLLTGIVIYSGWGIAIDSSSLQSSLPQDHFENHTSWLPSSFPISDGLDRTGFSFCTANAPAASSHEDSQTFVLRRERNINRQITAYIAFSETIEISLSIAEIIFPKHFFG